MALGDGARHILAAVAAAVGFLGIFFGLSLIWPVALGLAVLIYGALLLLIRRAAEDHEVKLADRVSLADIRAAAAALETAADRLTTAAAAAPAGERVALTEMASHLTSIKSQIEDDPQDFREARRFIVTYLPRIVEAAEAYVGLAERAGAKDAGRLSEIGARIRGFAPVIEEIDRACLANDFAALEVQVDVLAAQMERS